MDQRLAVFEGKSIRKTWHNGQWYFSVLDIVHVLTDSRDPKQYIKKMRSRDSILDSNWGTLCTPLELLAVDGKRRKVNCANTKSVFRIIQSIPSLKAEPFKLWLAQVGYERVQEIENPELAQERMRDLYRQKGHSKEWIEKRIRGIIVRNELTDEWKNRGVDESLEFAILTNVISKATFDKTVDEYREFKKLRGENLRDHMNSLELIFTMLGEAATTNIARVKNAQGFTENETAAKEGGEVAGVARKRLESKTGEKVVSSRNYLSQKEKKQLKKQ